MIRRVYTYTSNTNGTIVSYYSPLLPHPAYNEHKQKADIRITVTGVGANPSHILQGAMVAEQLGVIPLNGIRTANRQRTRNTAGRTSAAPKEVIVLFSTQTPRGKGGGGTFTMEAEY